MTTPEPTAANRDDAPAGVLPSPAGSGEGPGVRAADRMTTPEPTAANRDDAPAGVLPSPAGSGEGPGVRAASPPDRDSPDQAARLLAITTVRAGRAGVRRVESEVLRPLGLSYSGYNTLSHLWLLGAREPRQLARHAGVSVPSMTSLLNTLQRQGLIARERSSVDHRLVVVSITEDGARLVEAAHRGVNRIEATAATALSPEEQATMQRYLDRYLTAIGEDWAGNPEDAESRILLERYVAAAERSRGTAN